MLFARDDIPVELIFTELSPNKGKDFMSKLI